MSSPFQHIQMTMRFLFHEGSQLWKPAKGYDFMDIGTAIAGRYRIDRPITEFGRRVLWAVKPISAEAICQFCGLRVEDPQGSFCSHCGAELREEVFRMEVFPGDIDSEWFRRILGISHPGIVRVRDAFTIEPYNYIVSESISGATLDRLEVTLPARKIREMGIRLAEIVEYLHTQGFYNINLQLSNLECASDSPRVVSLSGCQLKRGLTKGDCNESARQDFQSLLVTIERLAAEYGAREEPLGCLLVALEELFGGEQLSGGEIRQTLSGLQFDGLLPKSKTP